MNGHGGPTANNLPRPATSFVGREPSVEECLRFHASARLLTVTGIGGSGKTRLALRVAERLLPSEAWARGATLWLDEAVAYAMEEI